jgi:hypothetical protein
VQIPRLERLKSPPPPHPPPNPSDGQQQDATEFLDFLASRLSFRPISLRRRTFTGALPDSSDSGAEERLHTLPVDIAAAVRTARLSALLDAWFHENVLSGLKRKLDGKFEVALGEGGV